MTISPTHESSCLPKFDLPSTEFQPSNYPNLEKSTVLFLTRGVATYLLKLIVCSHDNIMNDSSFTKGRKIASVIALTVASIFIVAPIGIVDALARSILALISSPLLLSDKTSDYAKEIRKSAVMSWFCSISVAIWLAPKDLLTAEHSFSHYLE
jgi:hypothetical protein